MEKLYGDKKNTALLLIISAILGVAFNVLFYKYRFGINYLIYMAMILAATFWALTFKKDFNKTVYLMMSAGIFLLAAGYFISSNEFFHALNFMLIPILYYLAILLSVGSEHLLTDLFVYTFVPISHMDKFIKCGAGLLRTQRNGKNKVAGKILLGVLLSACALVFIIPLMLNADKAFNVLFLKIFNFKISVDTIIQFILFLIVAFYGFALIYFIFHGLQRNSVYQPYYAPADENQQNQPYQNTADHNSYAYTLLTFVIVVGIVFLSFSFIQILYLFLKVGAGLPADFTYANYAREGVFQLWGLTAMNIVIVLVCEFLSRKITVIAPKIYNILFSVYILINFSMTASAFYKMMMYESAFGLTRARILVFLHLILQTVLLLALLYKIWEKRFPFLKTALIFTLIFYIGVNYINIDKIVAQRNIARYEATGDIDLQYLVEGLSNDAFETVYQFAIDKLGYEPGKEYTLQLIDMYPPEAEYDKALKLYQIYDKQGEVKRYYNNMHWQEYNLTAQRLIQLR